MCVEVMALLLEVMTLWLTVRARHCHLMIHEVGIIPFIAPCKAAHNRYFTESECHLILVRLTLILEKDRGRRRIRRTGGVQERNPSRQRVSEGGDDNDSETKTWLTHLHVVEEELPQYPGTPQQVSQKELNCV